MLPRRDIARVDAGSLQSDDVLALAMRMTDGDVYLFEANLRRPSAAVYSATAECVGSTTRPLPPSTVPVVVRGCGQRSEGEPPDERLSSGLLLEMRNSRCVDVVDVASPLTSKSVHLDYRRRVIWGHPRTILVLLLVPAAFTVDVVTFPLQLIFFPQVNRMAHDVDRDLGA
jgi:hypothetical protein